MHESEVEVFADGTIERAKFDVADLQVSPRPAPTAPRPDGAVIGTLVARDSDGVPRVDYPGNLTGQPLLARSVVELHPADIARQVVLMFDDGNRRKPILLGVLREQGTEFTSSDEVPAQSATDQYIEADGKRLEYRAEEEISLCCGKASITLTKAGKVIIRGEYVLSRSTGVNRVQGGSIQLN